MVVGNCKYLYFLARNLKILKCMILRNMTKLLCLHAVNKKGRASPGLPYIGKCGREQMFTVNRCSLIRGVHYERFHCNLQFNAIIRGPGQLGSLFKFLLRNIVLYMYVYTIKLYKILLLDIIWYPTINLFIPNLSLPKHTFLPTLCLSHFP